MLLQRDAAIRSESALVMKMLTVSKRVARVFMFSRHIITTTKQSIIKKEGSILSTSIETLVGILEVIMTLRAFSQIPPEVVLLSKNAGDTGPGMLGRN